MRCFVIHCEKAKIAHALLLLNLLKIKTVRKQKQRRRHAGRNKIRIEHRCNTHREAILTFEDIKYYDCILSTKILCHTHR